MSAAWARWTVEDLQEAGTLLVEDGNHGEYRPRPDEFAPIGTAFIRAADMADGRVLFESAEHINDLALRRIRKGFGKGGDVLFSHKGTVGKLALVPSDAPSFVCSPQTTFWRTLDEERLDRRFLYCFMRSPQFRKQWQAVKGETDMADYVSLTAQRRFDVAVPPPPTQRAIARVLGALDDKIDLDRRMSRVLEAMAQALFKSWFVDFAPVVSKADGRQPFGMDPETAALFPSRFVDSELGPIPEGWGVASVYKVADVHYGAPFASSRFNSERRGLPLLRIRDLADHEPQTWTDEVHPKGRTVRPGEIVVGMDGEFRAHVWRGPESWLNQRVCLLAPRSPAGVSFVLYSIHGPLEAEERSEVGTTVSHLGKADIDRFRVVSPHAPVLVRFTQRADPFLKRVVESGIEARALASLRDSLLPKLLSGEIRVKDAEREAERSL